MWPGKRVLLYSTFTLLTIFFSPAVSAALPSLTAISNLIDPHTPCTMFSPKSIPPKSPASPTISDRRADLPPSPTPVNAPLSTTSAETENVDQIIERITSRQDDGGLREGRKGISEATKEGTTGMGVVMANSHNDEMQHIPFVSRPTQRSRKLNSSGSLKLYHTRPAETRILPRSGLHRMRHLAPPSLPLHRSQDLPQIQIPNRSSYSNGNAHSR